MKGRLALLLVGPFLVAGLGLFVTLGLHGYGGVAVVLGLFWGVCLSKMLRVAERR